MPLGLRQLPLDGENTNEINTRQSKGEHQSQINHPLYWGFFMSEIILTIEPNDSYPLKSIPFGR